MKKKMFLLLCLLIFIPNIIADCPSDSVLWSPLSACYFFMTTPQNFSQAESSCNSLSGNLISIHDSFTNAFIFTEAKPVYPININISIGLSCISGNCSWTDGSSFDYNDFYNQNNQTGCATISLSNGYWNIGSCSEKKYYVCERPLTVTTSITTVQTTTAQVTITSGTPTSLCPSDEWYYFNETNSCYYWADSSNWTSAEAFCVSQNSHLTSIHSSAELNFLKFIYNGNVWIGLHADNGSIGLSTIWKWTDGSYLDYLPWGAGYGLPDMTYGYQCVQTSQNKVMNTICSTAVNSICKKPSSKIISTTGPSYVPKCLTGWTYYNGTDSCYTGLTPNSTQSVAESYCTSFGGHLASIHSDDEMQFLSYATSGVDFWIGLYTTDNPVQLNTTWQWTDNTSVNYIPWYKGLPTLDNKLCAVSTSNAFQNVNCSASYAGVCQQPPLYSMPTTSPVSTTTFKSPSPCNNVLPSPPYFFSSFQMNWTTAEEFCELCGGYLTSVHSLNELQTIASSSYQAFGYVDGNYWTGLYSDNNERTWKWIDGSPYDFSFWLAGNPSQAGSPCANLQISEYYSVYGMTNMKNCSTNLYGICKYHNH